MENKVYKVPLNSLSLVFGYVGLVIAGILLASLVLDVGAGRESSSLQIAKLVSSGLVSTVSIITLNRTPDIEFHQEGLKIQVFGFRWISVPWKNVVGLTEPVDVGPQLRGVLVRARGLTVFHRLVSLSYGIGITPGFVISDNIDGYTALVEIIRQKMEEQRDQEWLTR